LIRHAHQTQPRIPRAVVINSLRTAALSLDGGDGNQQQYQDFFERALPPQ